MKSQLTNLIEENNIWTALIEIEGYALPVIIPATDGLHLLNIANNLEKYSVSREQYREGTIYKISHAK